MHLVNPRRATVAASLLLALGLAACGGADPAEPGAARCLPEAIDCDDTPGVPAAGDAMLTAFVDRVDALPAGTRAVEMAPADSTFPLMVRQAVVEGDRLHLLVSGSEAPCMWIAATEVSEDDDEVVVSVLAGGDPSAEGCDTQPISDQSVTVQLASPLGERALLDATRVVPGDAVS